MHWLKLWTKGWLDGSIRFDLTPAQRSVFVDLCALARESRNPPMIQANPTTSYSHYWLASRLNISLELLEETLENCIAQGRISENGWGIKILNFESYQAKRDKKKQTKTRQKKDKNSQEVAVPESEITKLYEQEIGIISPKVAEEVKIFSDFFEAKGAPIEWIDEAFAEAVKNNVRKWSYIKAILENWIKHGKTGGKEEEEGLFCRICGQLIPPGEFFSHKCKRKSEET